MKDETAPAWLARIGRHDLVAEYDRFKALMLQVGSAERRSLWDLLAGIRYYDKNTGDVHFMRQGVQFRFPVFAEACDYRGVARKPGAIVTNIRPHAHRKPQVAKWGPELRNLVKS